MHVVLSEILRYPSGLRTQSAIRGVTMSHWTDIVGRAVIMSHPVLLLSRYHPVPSTVALILVIVAASHQWVSLLV